MRSTKYHTSDHNWC